MAVIFVTPMIVLRFEYVVVYLALWAVIAAGVGIAWLISEALP